VDCNASYTRALLFCRLARHLIIPLIVANFAASFRNPYPIALHPFSSLCGEATGISLHDPGP
jgi:hypothetical protein